MFLCINPISSQTAWPPYLSVQKLGWYTVVGLLYLSANSWDGCFLSVLTALLVHCCKFISAQTAALARSFSTTSQLAHCSNFISMLTAQFKKLRWYTAVSFCQGKQDCFCYEKTAPQVHWSKLKSRQTAQLPISLSANSSAGTLKLKLSWCFLLVQTTRLVPWYSVNSSQCKQPSWRFLYVQTAQLVHCSKLISGQTAWLIVYFFCKQLRWFTVVKQLGWHFLSV